MNIIFKNKGILSLLDLTTMGDSDKKYDLTKIGKFDSGLKYALAILYRYKIVIKIYSNMNLYTFGTTVLKDDKTDKIKEVLVIKEFPYLDEPNDDVCEYCKDNYSPSNPCECSLCEEALKNYLKDNKTEYTTAFSPNLGYNWELWMAFREIYSNCIDENGEIIFTEDINYKFINNYTQIIINNVPKEILDNWNNYFLNGEKILYEEEEVKIYKNTSEHLKLYKNKILIFEDKNIKSKYMYDYGFASIDERRILNDKQAFISAIENIICYCKSKEFIKSFIENIKKDSFEYTFNYYFISQKWVEVVNEQYKENLLINTCLSDIPNLYEVLLENPDINIGIKKISYNSPSYSYIKAIVKETTTKELNFEDRIKKICLKGNFNIIYPIIESHITRFTCISDINKKVLYVSKDFNEKNIWEMIKAHFRIESNDDPDYCFKQYTKLLKE